MELLKGETIEKFVIHNTYDHNPSVIYIKTNKGMYKTVVRYNVVPCTKLDNVHPWDYLALFVLGQITEKEYNKQNKKKYIDEARSKARQLENYIKKHNLNGTVELKINE